MSVTTLPVECAFEVLSYLPENDLFNFSQTSWYSCSLVKGFFRPEKNLVRAIKQNKSMSVSHLLGSKKFTQKQLDQALVVSVYRKYQKLSMYLLKLGAQVNTKTLSYAVCNQDHKFLKKVSSSLSEDQIDMVSGLLPCCEDPVRMYMELQPRIPLVFGSMITGAIVIDNPAFVQWLFDISDLSSVNIPFPPLYMISSFEMMAILFKYCHYEFDEYMFEKFLVQLQYSEPEVEVFEEFERNANFEHSFLSTCVQAVDLETIMIKLHKFGVSINRMFHVLDVVEHAELGQGFFNTIKQNVVKYFSPDGI